MKNLLRQPLLHFAVLGTALFALWSAVGNRSSGDAGQRIDVGPAQVERLVQAFQQTWRRPPTESELQGLLDDHIREEIYYREALAMGLDQDDQVIRRRMRQKIELLSSDIAQSATPTEQELAQFLAENAEDYRLEPRTSFVHVFVSTDRRGGDATSHAEGLLETLVARGEPDAGDRMGDPFPLPRRFRDVEGREVSRTFGPDFAADVLRTPTGGWQGPIESGYGLHLVYVEERVEGRPAELDEVRSAVTRDLLFQKQGEVDDAVFEKLRERYEITVRLPESLTTPAGAIVGDGS